MLKWLRALEPPPSLRALPVFAGISLGQSMALLLLLHGFDSVYNPDTEVERGIVWR